MVVIEEVGEDWGCPPASLKGAQTLILVELASLGIGDAASGSVKAKTFSDNDGLAFSHYTWLTLLTSPTQKASDA